MSPLQRPHAGCVLKCVFRPNPCPDYDDDGDDDDYDDDAAAAVEETAVPAVPVS